MKRSRLFASGEWAVNEFSCSAWKSQQMKAIKKIQYKEKNQTIQ